MNLEKDDLLKLYEMMLEEEHTFAKIHQERIAFYSGFVTALVAGITAGIFQATEWYEFAALSIGPLLLVAISSNAIDGTSRVYQRLLETITVRAKIERDLGLTTANYDQSEVSESYWTKEPMIPERHIASRMDFDTSKDFIQHHLDKGFRGVMLRLFRGLQFVGILLFIFLLTLAVLNAPCV